MHPLLVAVIASAVSASAPVASVTVFNDRARVVREAQLDLHGPSRFDLALLPDSVDPGSIRLELSVAKGAEVRQVDVLHVDTDLFPEADARKLLDQLDEADDRLALAAQERRALSHTLAQVQGLRPVSPLPDLRGPAPKLNPSGWAQVLAFLSNSSERLQARLRDVSARIEQLGREREKLADEARALGASHRRSGLQVSALLAGEGRVQAKLTYMVGGARWRPSWELRYRPGDETVQAQLAGLVWQATGEEWTRSKLVLSTAIPGAPTALPELLSWRIGEKERFLPISQPVRSPPRPRPLPRVVPEPDEASSAGAVREKLRARLLERATPPDLDDDEAESAVGDETGAAQAANGVSSSASYGMAAKAASAAPMPMEAPPPPPALAPPRVSKEQMALVPYGRNSRNFDSVLSAKPGAHKDSYDASETNYVVDGVQVQVTGEKVVAYQQIGLAPPPSWSPPTFDPDAPASLAGGFDLSFTSANPATLESGSAARKVPLFSESWPVRTERLVYPALAAQAWLVGKLKIPSERTLPGGDAELFVGDDPAGHARLTAMAPGEEITLPLGIDRAIQPVRNVSQVRSEKGLFSKDDVDEYVVTIELANPYARPIALRVRDQVPLKGSDILDVELVSTQPAATPDHDSGQLEWAFELPASQKTTLTFSYRLRRPHGARLHQ